MKTIEILEILRKKPVFKLSDIERITLSKRNYAKLILNRLKKKGLIKKITENVYTTKKDIFVLSSNLTYPSYISFWTAVYYLGYTEQIVNDIYIAVTKKRKNIIFEGYKINFIPMKYFFGYKKINTTDGELFIADNEKLILDSLLKWKFSGNFDEIKKIFQNAEISKEKLIFYLKKINNQTLIKRTGYLLFEIKKIDISKSFKLDRNYVVLNPFLKKWKKTNSKWRVKL